MIQCCFWLLSKWFGRTGEKKIEQIYTERKKRPKRKMKGKRKQMCRQYRISDNSVKNYNYNKYNARFMSRHRFWVIFGNKVFFLLLSNALHDHDELQAWALETFSVNPDFSNDSQSATFFGYCSCTEKEREKKKKKIGWESVPRHRITTAPL